MDQNGSVEEIAGLVVYSALAHVVLVSFEPFDVYLHKQNPPGRQVVVGFVLELSVLLLEVDVGSFEAACTAEALHEACCEDAFLEVRLATSVDGACFAVKGATWAVDEHPAAVSTVPVRFAFLEMALLRQVGHIAHRRTVADSQAVGAAIVDLVVLVARALRLNVSELSVLSFLPYSSWSWWVRQCPSRNCG